MNKCIYHTRGRMTTNTVLICAHQWNHLASGFKPSGVGEKMVNLSDENIICKKYTSGDNLSPPPLTLMGRHETCYCLRQSNNWQHVTRRRCEGARITREVTARQLPHYRQLRQVLCDSIQLHDDSVNTHKHTKDIDTLETGVILNVHHWQVVVKYDGR